MPPTSPPQTDTSLPAWSIAPFLIGATLALAGGFWDDAWHTERGRDSFFIAPHVAIYSGITLAGGALGLWAFLTLRRRGLTALADDRPLALALLSVGLTLASAPVDNFWHVAFGRDAVIWSPPHVLGIIGTAGLAVAILIELQRSRARWARPLRWLAGALLLAAFSFLVVEYDTDVPQFPVVWYVPVLALGSSLALAIVRSVTRARLAATRTAVVHLAYFGLVTLFLLSQGFDTPKAPLVIAAALVLDLSAERGLPLPAQAALYAVTLYAVYVPALDLLGSGLTLDASDVALGLPLSFAAVLLVLGLTSGRVPGLTTPARVATAVLVSLAVLLALAAPASAHDPGQGPEAGAFEFDARLSNGTLAVTARRAGDDCGALAPVGLVARRAGQTERGPLTRSGCVFEGTVRLPDEGRWFVYLDARKEGETVESWIPVTAGEDEQRVISNDRFAYRSERKEATAVKWIAGSVMYALVIVFLVAMLILVRRSSADLRRTTGRTQRSA